MAVENVRDNVQALVDYAATRDLIGWTDRVWSYNATLEAIGALGPGPEQSWVLAEEPDLDAEPAELDLEATLADLAEVAVTNGCVEDTANGRDRVAMRVMGCLPFVP